MTHSSLINNLKDDLKGFESQQKIEILKRLLNLFYQPFIIQISNEDICDGQVGFVDE